MGKQLMSWGGGMSLHPKANMQNAKRKEKSLLHEMKSHSK